MADIKDYTILLVPGFLAQIYDAVSKEANALSTESLINAAKKIPLIGGEVASLIPRLGLPVDEDSGKSFFAQEKAFHERDIDCVDMVQYPAFSSQNGVEANGAVIRKALGKMGSRKVLIVSHSKGGLDTLDALINADDSLLATVHGWLSLQAPFLGSPLADAGSGVLPINLGAVTRALEDIHVSVRRPYMKRLEGDITSLLQRIPVTCAFSTYQASTRNALANAAHELAKNVFDPKILSEIPEIVPKNLKRYRYRPPTAAAHNVSDAISLISKRFNQTVKDVVGSFGVMDITNNIMESLPNDDLVTEPNDGLVAEESAKLPGAHIFELSPNTDHAGPVMSATPFRNFWTPEQRVEYTEARLTELINR